MNKEQELFNEIWEAFPPELRSKCNSCGETTTHIAMSAMAKLKVSENKIAQMLGEKIGKKANVVRSRMRRGKADPKGSAPSKSLKSLKKSKNDIDSQKIDKKILDRIKAQALKEAEARILAEQEKDRWREKRRKLAAKAKAKKKEKEAEEREERQAAKIQQEEKGVMGEMDAWDIFGIDGDRITEESLKILYRGLAMRRHPDQGGNELLIRELNIAYNTLKLKCLWRR